MENNLTSPRLDIVSTQTALTEGPVILKFNNYCESSCNVPQFTQTSYTSSESSCLNCTILQTIYHLYTHINLPSLHSHQSTISTLTSIYHLYTHIIYITHAPLADPPAHAGHYDLI